MASNINILKEACVGSYQEAYRAWQQGANRIELCADLAVGGVTPSKGTIAQVVKDIPLPIFVLIRPRGGDFYFTDAEYHIMQQDIVLCAQLGVKGVVIGGLSADKQIDSRVKSLIESAGKMQITFHKAFDEIPSLNAKLSAIDQIISLGCHRILSSASGVSIFDEVETYKKLIGYADNRIKFVACGGVTDKNLPEAMTAIPTDEFHGKLIVGKLTD